MFSRFLLSLSLESLALRSREARRIWQGLLALAGGVMALTLACVTPFPAMAMLASRTLAWRAASLTLFAAVVANQLAGFFVLGFPRTLESIAWGPVFFVATVAAYVVSRSIAQPPAALVAAFAVYEGVLAAYTLVTEHSLAAFAPAIVLKVAEANAIGFAVLGLSYLAVLAVERATVAAPGPARRT